MISIPSFSNANQALILLGTLSEVAKKGMTLELQQTIVSLKEAILELKSENLDLKERTRVLEKELTEKRNLVFEKPNYYLLDENNSKDGPFCQVCKDNSNKLVRLQTVEEGSWTCGACQGHFQTQERADKSTLEFARLNQSFKSSVW